MPVTYADSEVTRIQSRISGRAIGTPSAGRYRQLGALFVLENTGAVARPACLPPWENHLNGNGTLKEGSKDPLWLARTTADSSPGAAFTLFPGGTACWKHRSAPWRAVTVCVPLDGHSFSAPVALVPACQTQPPTESDLIGLLTPLATFKGWPESRLNRLSSDEVRLHSLPDATYSGQVGRSGQRRPGLPSYPCALSIALGQRPAFAVLATI